jgi:hypothetical protein
MLQITNSATHQSAVTFELRFTGPTQADTATFLATQVAPHLLEARKRILELGQLHLEAGFHSLGASGEDVEDQLTAIQNLHASRFLQVSRLCRRQIVIEDDNIGIRSLDELSQLTELARADVCCELDIVALLKELANDHGSGGRR